MFTYKFKDPYTTHTYFTVLISFPNEVFVGPVLYIHYFQIFAICTVMAQSCIDRISLLHTTFYSLVSHVEPMHRCWFWKSCHVGRTRIWRRRYFVMFGRSLAYFKTSNTQARAIAIVDLGSNIVSPQICFNLMSENPLLKLQSVILPITLLMYFVINSWMLCPFYTCLANSRLDVVNVTRREPIFTIRSTNWKTLRLKASHVVGKNNHFCFFYSNYKLNFFLDAILMIIMFFFIYLGAFNKVPDCNYGCLSKIQLPCEQTCHKTAGNEKGSSFRAFFINYDTKIFSRSWG